MSSTANPPPVLDDRIHEMLGSRPPLQPPTVDAAEATSPLEALAGRLRSGTLEPAQFAAPIAAVLSRVDGRRPLLTAGRDGSPLLLTSRLGGRVRVERGDGTAVWLGRRDLAAELGLEHPNQEHRWMSVEDPAAMKLDLHGHASPWRNAMVLLSGEGNNIVSIVIYAVGVGLLSLALPLAVQTLVNTVAFGQLLQPIVVLTFLLAGGLVFAATLTALQTWMVEIVQRRLFIRLVSELADRLPRAHIKAFDHGGGPELLNRFFDVFTAQKAASSLLLDGIGALLTALVGVLVLAFYHPVLLGFGIVLTGSVTVVMFGLGRGATNSTIHESKSKYAVAGWLQEMARHPFALKMAGGGDYARKRLDGLAASWLRDRASHFRVFYRQLVGALALQVIAHASLLGVGGWLVVERELSIGQLVAAELIVTAIVASLSKLGGKLETVYDLVAAADKLGALLSLPLEDDVGEDEANLKGPASVELRDVHSEDGLVQGLTLTIDPGEVVAVRGDRRHCASLVDILFGLRDPVAGVVLIGGQDLRDVKRRSLRERVGVVRSPEVLPCSVANNVRAVGRELPASQIWQLLDLVGLSETVRRLPHGLQTELAPSGFPLDRVESLRLTLARAMAADPSLLVLDGVLDALPEDERVPLLRAVAKGRTTLITTHERAIADECEFSLRLGKSWTLEGGAK